MSNRSNLDLNHLNKQLFHSFQFDSIEIWCYPLKQLVRLLNTRKHKSKQNVITRANKCTFCKQIYVVKSAVIVAERPNSIFFALQNCHSNSKNSNSHALSKRIKFSYYTANSKFSHKIKYSVEVCTCS